MRIQKFEFNPVSENTYVIYDDETHDAAIIDCGAHYPDEKEQLKEFIATNKLTPTHLLNTHLHMDHAFGNQFIFETYGLRPEYNQAEESMPSLQKQSALFGINTGNHPSIAARYLNDGDTITVGNIRLKALLVPGHSPGSLCFYSEEDQCIFSGDVLFEYSVGRSDLWGGNHHQLISGIKEKLLTLQDETVVYPGHGPATTIGKEKQHNSFLQ